LSSRSGSRWSCGSPISAAAWTCGSGQYWIGISFPIAIVLAVLGFLLLHGLLRLIAFLRGWPERRRRAKAERQRGAADRSLTLALVALAAGRGEAARIEVKRARKLVGDSPHLLLLSAEAARMQGDEAGAREGLRGAGGAAGREVPRPARPLARGGGEGRLGRGAPHRRRGAGGRARRQVAEEERSEVALRRQDWREALSLAGPEAPRAALSLAAAQQEEDPAKAGELERQAFMADPRFSPGVVAYAKRLAEAGSPRRARSVLQEGWAAAPHPDIAEAVLSIEPDPLKRVKLVDDLTRSTVSHPESRLLRARVALQAGLTGRARQDLQAWLDTGAADRRCHALLVELERAEHGP
jgi:HemY protein